MNTEEFISQANNIHNNIYGYDQTLVTHKRTKVCILCTKHGRFYQTPYNHIIRKHGCPKCVGDKLSSKFSMTTQDFITRAVATHGNLYLYDKAVCEKSTTPTTITCRIHGDFIQQPRHHINGHGCSKCNRRSSLELRTVKALEDISEPFTEQKTFPDCKGARRVLPFDFYLINLNILIECDGQQHYNPIHIFGGERSFMKTQQNDAIKTNYCKEKGICLIRIPYWIDDITSYLLTEIQKSHA